MLLAVIGTEAQWLGSSSVGKDLGLLVEAEHQPCRLTEPWAPSRGVWALN